MRRPTYLQTLTVGRCFTEAVDPSSLDEEERAERFRAGQPLMAPPYVWKVVGAADSDTVTCQSAASEERAFPSNTMVIEVPREGFERLLQRAAAAERAAE